MIAARVIAAKVIAAWLRHSVHGLLLRSKQLMLLFFTLIS
jgi:hypothetical protein